LDWNVCLQYKFPEAPKDSWVLQDDGNGVYIKEWKLVAPKPTKEELQAVETQAVAWWREKQKTDKANYEDWSAVELRALVKVLLDEINVLRQKQGLPARTPEQLKSAIKEKL
jgi:hypothetical protein